MLGVTAMVDGVAAAMVELCHQVCCMTQSTKESHLPMSEVIEENSTKTCLTQITQTAAIHIYFNCPHARNFPVNPTQLPPLNILISQKNRITNLHHRLDSIDQPHKRELISVHDLLISCSPDPPHNTRKLISKPSWVEDNHGSNRENLHQSCYILYTWLPR